MTRYALDVTSRDRHHPLRTLWVEARTAWSHCSGRLFRMSEGRRGDGVATAPIGAA